MTGSKRKGFSIVEVVIYIFVASLVTAAFGYFVTDMLIGRTRDVAAIEIQENARLAIDRLAVDILEARLIMTTSSAFDVNLATSSTAALTLTMTSSTLNPTVYDVQGGVLRVRQGSAATATPVTADSVRVTDLTFRNYTQNRARNIDITLSLDHVQGIPGIPASASTTLRTSVTLRNR